jgi:hypothetical protein
MNWRWCLQLLLTSVSLCCLAVATFAGLMHQWHRLAFISFASLDNSFIGTVGLIFCGMICWIWAGFLTNKKLP